MKEYHKINTLFNRDPQTKKIIMGEWSQPEFDFLQAATWRFEEKINGMNVRGYFNGEKVEIAGRGDNADFLPHVPQFLQQLFDLERFRIALPINAGVLLFGECYGPRITKGGGLYFRNAKEDAVDFCLFDVMIGGLFLRREDVYDISSKLGIIMAPLVGSGTLADAVELCRNGFRSHWGDFPAEGVVLRPLVELQDRRGRRVIGKLKCKDFAK